MKLQNNIIGVLGGIGPASTGEFYLNLISKLQEGGLVKSNVDFPQIIINSIPAPELIYEKISDKDLDLYIKGLKELDEFGVDFIVMVCNTIHLFYEKLQNEIRVPIIDLRKELNNLLIKKKVKSIVVLSTFMTKKQGLYQFAGFEYFNLDKRDEELITKAIFNFNKGLKKTRQICTVKEIAEKYLDKGAEIVVLGCTELALMLKDIDIPKINTIEVLSGATIKKLPYGF